MPLKLGMMPHPRRHPTLLSSPIPCIYLNYNKNTDLSQEGMMVPFGGWWY